MFEVLLKPLLARRWSLAGVGLVALAVGCDDGTTADRSTATDGPAVAVVTPADQDARTASAVNTPQQAAAPAATQPSGAEQSAPGVVGSRTAEVTGESIAIEKTIPETVKVGARFTYDITVRNTSDGSLAGVTVTEQLPRGFEFVSAEPAAQPQADGGHVRFDLGQLEQGATRTLRITGVPHEPGELTACTTYDFRRGICTPLVVANPQLQIERTAPEQANLCEPVTISYVVRNTGDTPAQQVRLYEQLPEGLTLVGNDDGQQGQRTVDADLGTLAPGQEVQRQVEVRAEQATEFTSYAIARGQLDEVSSRRGTTRFIAPQLQVQVRPTRDYEYIGRAAGFEVTVTNTGEGVSPMTLVNVSSERGEIARIGRPGGAEAQLASDQPQDGNAHRIGALEPGQSQRFFVEVRGSEEGEVKLAAVARSVCPANRELALAEAQNAGAIAFVAVTSLQVTVVDKVDPVRVGEQTVYEINVLNEGNGEDTNLQLRGELPEGVSFVGAEGPTQVSADGRTLTFAPLQRLGGGENATWYVTVRADQAAGATQFRLQVQSQNVTEPVRADEPTRLY